MLMNNNALNAYRSVSENTGGMDGSHIVALLLDGCKSRSKSAADAIAAGDQQAKHLHISKALDIVNQGLIAHLDMSYPVSKDLYAAYGAASLKLIDANFRDDAQAALDAAAAFESLREAFDELSRRAR